MRGGGQDVIKREAEILLFFKNGKKSVCNVWPLCLYAGIFKERLRASEKESKLLAV
jgi:hypothetical protein